MLADQAPASEDKLGDGAEHYFSFFLYHSVCPVGCAQFWEIDFQDTQKPSVHSPTRPTVEESHHALGPLTRQPLALRIYRRSFPATLLQRGRNWVQNLWVVSKSNYISGAGERSNCTRCNQLFSNGCPKIKVESRAKSEWGDHALSPLAPDITVKPSLGGRREFWAWLQPPLPAALALVTMFWGWQKGNKTIWTFQTLLSRGHVENWHSLSLPPPVCQNHYQDHLIHRKIGICFIDKGLDPAFTSNARIPAVLTSCSLSLSLGTTSESHC